MDRRPPGSNAGAPPIFDRSPLVVEANGHRQVVLPPLARLLLTKEQRAARERLLAGQFFLVNMRLGNLGEVLRCGRCNGKHARFTRYCIDRPFSGLTGALYGYVTTVEQARALDILPPEHRARVEALRVLFGPRPDLADTHPLLARQLAGARAPGEVDLDIGMVALGLLERVEPRDAQRLLDRINTRAVLYREPPLAIPGLRTRQ